MQSLFPPYLDLNYLDGDDKPPPTKKEGSKMTEVGALLAKVTKTAKVVP